MKLSSSILITLVVAAGATALAQPAGNPVLAEQLFEQGRALAKHNDWEHACPKFEASLHYDASLGTKLNLATCYEKVGKLASAWSLYHDAADQAGAAHEVKRHDYALARASALEPRLPRLMITAPATVPDGFTVTRDRVGIEAAALGTNLYVDPGSHTIAATAPGFESFSKTVTATEGQTTTVAIPPLQPVKVAAVPPPRRLAQPAPEPAHPHPDVLPVSHARRYAGIATTVAGVALTGVGLAFGAKASSTYSDAKRACPDLACASPADLQRGRQLVSDARSDGNISTVMVIAGGAAIAGGLVLWLTAPHAHRTETAHLVPSLTPRSAGMALMGSF